MIWLWFWPSEWLLIQMSWRILWREMSRIHPAGGEGGAALQPNHSAGGHSSGSVPHVSRSHRYSAGIKVPQKRWRWCRERRKGQTRGNVSKTVITKDKESQKVMWPMDRQHYTSHQGHDFCIIPSGNHYFSTIFAPLRICCAPLMSCSIGVCLNWHEGCFKHCPVCSTCTVLSWRSCRQDWKWWMYRDFNQSCFFCSLLIYLCWKAEFLVSPISLNL